MKHLEQRRNFLKKAIALGGGVSLLGSPLAGQAAMFGSPSKLDTSGYKALVCIDLDGGNDGTNMVVATDPTDYASYKKFRANLAIDKAQLLPLNNTQYGLHPSLRGIQKLFNREKSPVAILANVGPMVKGGRVGGTPRFGSHSFQRTLWAGFNPGKDLESRNGWMGRIADLDNGMTCGNISVAGSSSWQRGYKTRPFKLSREGIKPFTKRNDLEAIREALAVSDVENSNSAFINGYAQLDQGTRQQTETYAQALHSPEVNKKIDELPVKLPNSPLGIGLETVLRTIIARKAFAMPRQSFQLSLGGFDFHNKHRHRQERLLGQVDQAVYAFQRALEHLNLDQMVTTFTMSDFGRTTTNNGAGTGHGWGSHHFIIGGAVTGGKIYGRMPKIEIGNPDNPDIMGHKGILRPSKSVDQYAATLARWYGVSETDMDKVVPNLHLFKDEKDLGFMA